MITLNEVTKQFLTQFAPYLKIRKEKIMIKAKEGNVTIPSALYPLNDKDSIDFFCCVNTVPLTAEVENYEIIKEVFDSQKLITGYCYQNTNAVYQGLLQAGISAEDVKTYVGWVLTGNRPIHHCWLVYKDEYLLDGGVLAAELQARQFFTEQNITDINVQREILTDLMVKNMDLPNHETRSFGQAFPTYEYVGSVCDPNEGREIYTKLIAEFPNHPSYRAEGQNPTGASKTQEILYRKMKK